VNSQPFEKVVVELFTVAPGETVDYEIVVVSKIHYTGWDYPFKGRRRIKFTNDGMGGDHPDDNRTSNPKSQCPNPNAAVSITIVTFYADGAPVLSFIICSFVIPPTCPACASA